jgi:hypothetical protein
MLSLSKRGGCRSRRSGTGCTGTVLSRRTRLRKPRSRPPPPAGVRADEPANDLGPADEPDSAWQGKGGRPAAAACSIRPAMPRRSMRYLRRCREGHAPATTHGVQPILDGFATGLAAVGCCRLQLALRDYLIVGHAPPNPPTSTCSPNSASSDCSPCGCGCAKPAAPPSPCRLSLSPPGSSPNAALRSSWRRPPRRHMPPPTERRADQAGNSPTSAGR